MTVAETITLNATASALPEGSDAIPEWIHLLPAGVIATQNKLGPFRVRNAADLIARSMADGKIAVDFNHSIDTAAPNGGASPAVGWITEMQARDDGIWGRVEWNRSGRELLEDKAYRAISPVTVHDAKTRDVIAILRASLVNTPNLRGLTALHSDNSEKETFQMDWRKTLIDALGLDGGASDDEIKTALNSALNANNGKNVKAMSELAKLAGLAEDAEGEAVVTALNSRLADAPTEDEVKALQSELAGVTTELNTLKEGRARDKAEAFIDDAIAERRVGLNSANRERYIARHMKDPAGTEADIRDLPMLGETATSIRPPAPKEGEVALNSAQAAVAKQLGQSPEDYAKTLELEQKKEAV